MLTKEITVNFALCLNNIYIIIIAFGTKGYTLALVQQSDDILSAAGCKRSKLGDQIVRVWS